jgi:NADPH2:quinone reductase
MCSAPSAASCSNPDRLPALLFANVTLRLFGSDDFPAEAKRQDAADLTTAGAAGRLLLAVR